MDVDVQREFARRGARPAQLRSTPHGLTCVAGNLAIDISATSIREALMNGRTPAQAMLPEPVLDYIQQHHLYERKTH
jgi:nicotinate-nucleotide adenylyltransferase